MSQFDVLCVGAVNHDILAVVDHLPTDDERMMSPQMTTANGGPAATAAVTLARLGYRVAISAGVGRDPEGDAIIDGMQTAGVDTRYITRDPDMTTSRTIILANAQTSARSIVTAQPNGGPTQFPLDVAPVVHVDQVGFGFVNPILDPTQQRMSIDAGNPIPGLTLENAWLYAPTVAVLRGRYGHGIAESGPAALADGAQIVVATDGSRGSYWFDSTHTTHVEAYPVPIVSTLGAGDVFHGALLAAVLDGSSPDDALRFANACAGLSCRSLDGQSGIPTRAEIAALISATPIP